MSLVTHRHQMDSRTPLDAALISNSAEDPPAFRDIIDQNPSVAMGDECYRLLMALVTPHRNGEPIDGTQSHAKMGEVLVVAGARLAWTEPIPNRQDLV